MQPPGPPVLTHSSLSGPPGHWLPCSSPCAPPVPPAEMDKLLLLLLLLLGLFPALFFQGVGEALGELGGGEDTEAEGALPGRCADQLGRE